MVRKGHKKSQANYAMDWVNSLCSSLSDTTLSETSLGAQARNHIVARLDDSEAVIQLSPGQRQCGTGWDTFYIISFFGLGEQPKKKQQPTTTKQQQQQQQPPPQPPQPQPQHQQPQPQPPQPQHQQPQPQPAIIINQQPTTTVDTKSQLEMVLENLAQVNGWCWRVVWPMKTRNAPGHKEIHQTNSDKTWLVLATNLSAIRMFNICEKPPGVLTHVWPQVPPRSLIEETRGREANSIHIHAGRDGSNQGAWWRPI